MKVVEVHDEFSVEDRRDGDADRGRTPADAAGPRRRTLWWLLAAATVPWLTAALLLARP